MDVGLGRIHPPRVEPLGDELVAHLLEIHFARAGRIGVIIGVEITGPDPVLVPHLQIALIGPAVRGERLRSEEHTSELQSLMRISYAVFCLKKKRTNY